MNPSTQRVRLVGIDPNGSERPGAWAEAEPSASLTLTFASGNTVVLETATARLTMAVTGARIRPSRSTWPRTQGTEV